jgi:hypothetical protein
MMKILKKTIDGREYELGPILAGQMREQAEKRLASPNPRLLLHESNFSTVASCLNNASCYTSENKPWTLDDIAKLTWPTYIELLEAASEISGFNLVREEVGKTGEGQAASPAGIGSTVASPLV